jgi:hypothetical protein
MVPTAEEQVRFLLNIQRLLGEGLFTATYKYALLMALADWSVELGDDSGEALELSTQKSHSPSCTTHPLARLQQLSVSIQV